MISSWVAARAVVHLKRIAAELKRYNDRQDEKDRERMMSMQRPTLRQSEFSVASVEKWNENYEKRQRGET